MDLSLATEDDDVGFLQHLTIASRKSNGSVQSKASPASLPRSAVMAAETRRSELAPQSWLRSVADAENAAHCTIKHKFGGKVIVKVQHRGLNGPEFRRAYQSARG